jgi:hypothetical protein
MPSVEREAAALGFERDEARLLPNFEAADAPDGVARAPVRPSTTAG